MQVRGTIATIYKFLFTTFIYVVWKEQNYRIFQSIAFNTNIIVSLIMSLLKLYIISSLHVKLKVGRFYLNNMLTLEFDNFLIFYNFNVYFLN